MASIWPEVSKNVAYMHYEQQKYISRFRSPLPYLFVILELPNIPDDDQEAWSHI